MAVGLTQFMTRPLYFIKDRYKLAGQRLTHRSIIKISIIIIALALAFIPVPASLVERYYSNGLYPRLQSMLTPVANRIPFALVDSLVAALIMGVPAWWVVRMAKAPRGRRKRVAARLAFHTLVFASVIFLGFQ